MKLNAASLTSFGVYALTRGGSGVDAQGQMVKMCLFYESPSGHARSDPIINQTCASDHVHTFYGPQDFHPDTTYQDLQKAIKTPALSTSPFVENQSLYWHPSIYRVVDNPDGSQTYTRVSNLQTSPYYRWDNSVVDGNTEAFPPGFRMIASSTDKGAKGGEGKAIFTECCGTDDEGEESCKSWKHLYFPTNPCGFLGIALAMPTCWNGELGDKNDHKDHMAYTLDGSVAGECPKDHPRRLPQVQLFLRINDYQGGKYLLSDGNDGSVGNRSFHVDFFNGWQEGKLKQIIDKCRPYRGQDNDEYNPPCDCTSREINEDIRQSFLTPNENVPDPVCDNAVRRLIINEVTDVVNGPLPRGTCSGQLIEKSWEDLTTDLYTCEPVTATTLEATTTTTSAETTSNPVTTKATTTQASTTSNPETTKATTTEAETTTTKAKETTEATTTTTTEDPPTEDPDPAAQYSDMRWVVCGGQATGCDDGQLKEVDVEDIMEHHAVRCCREENGGGWKRKCPDYNDELFAKSKIGGKCRKSLFWDAIEICHKADARLCTKDEVLNDCTKGSGCNFNDDLVWTCTEEDELCIEHSECCSGVCHNEEDEPCTEEDEECHCVWPCAEEGDGCDEDDDCCDEMHCLDEECLLDD